MDPNRHSFEVEVDDCRIENYEEILSRFYNWKKYKREINLNTLLEEGKKIQFDVEISNKQTVFYVSVSDDFIYTDALVNACSVVKKFTFIILNSQIINLRIEVNFLDTMWGKIVSSIVNSGVELKLQQNINIKNQIDNFYLQLPKEAA